MSTTIAPPPPSLAVLKRLIKQRYQIDVDLYNVTKSTLAPNILIVFHRNGQPASHTARVIEVTGEPGHIRICVEKVNSVKRMWISVDEITGIVQEG